MGPVIRRRASQTGRATRATSLATALALGLSGLLAMPAGAKDTEPSDLVEACSDAPSAKDRFNDYNSRSAREKTVIDCLNRGYVGNKSDQDYVLQGNGSVVSFDATISRAQFAAILNRVADYIGVQVHNAPSNATFADVPTSHFFFGEIEELAARGLTNGLGDDVDDVDNDGNTSEDIYNPNGTVSYAQVLAFVHRLLTEPSAANLTLASNRSKGQANSLDCGFFNGEKAELDNAGFLIFANTPNDCRLASPRGLVFDLIAVSFDEAVQQGVITSPHAVAPGSVKLVLDRDTALTNETVAATVTVKDGNGAAVSGQRVEVFAVKASDAFDNQGNPKADGTLNVAGTGRHGTGNTPATIDGADPVTNAQGVVTATIATTATSGGTFDVYAFVGDTTVVWKDVSDTADATGKQTTTFKAVPAGITVDSNASVRDTLKYATPHTVVFQLVDANGKPVAAEGIKVVAELFRSDDCTGPPTTTAPCNGAERRFAVQTLTTNANGVANWNVSGAPDPQPSNGSGCDDGVCDDGGDLTVDRFHGTWDQNGNNLPDDAVFTSPDLQMTFRDASPGKVDVATFRFLDGNNPNRLDVTGARVSTVVNLEANVTDVYGKPAEGVMVQFSRGVGSEPIISSTGGNGIATATITGPANPTDWTYTATVDNDIPANGFSPADPDLAATSPTGDTDVTIHWLGQPASVYQTPTAQTIVGFSLSGDYVDIHSADLRMPYDGGDCFIITGSNDCQGIGAFESALTADTGSDDTLSIFYQAGGISTYTLTVNGSSGPVGTR